MLSRFLFITFMTVTLANCSYFNKDKNMSVDEQAVESGIFSETVDGIGIGEGSMYEEVTLSDSLTDFVSNVGDRVYFGYDRYDLSADARAQLEMQAQWLQQRPNLRVTIAGHADERGTREYNLALGDRRAESVKRYLIALGVDGNRVNTISYGKEQPVALGSDPESWALNRRAVTIVE